MGQASSLALTNHERHEEKTIPFDTFIMQRLHKRHIQRLQSMTRGRYEVETAMNAIVTNVASIETGFVFEVLLKLIVDVGDDGFEATVVVYRVSVTRGVDHG